MGNDFYINLGKNIKKYRKEKNLTQQELADLANISLNFMGKIEVAFCRPSLDTVSDLCKFYDEKL